MRPLFGLYDLEIRSLLRNPQMLDAAEILGEGVLDVRLARNFRCINAGGGLSAGGKRRPGQLLTINRKIRVKIIVTADFKKELLEEIQQSVQKIEAELSFLEQRAKKTLTELTIKASPQVQAVREQLEWEKKKREESRASLLEQGNKISTLEEGVEILQGEIEGPVEIKIGDNWEDIFSKEIVLKDGKVVEIR